MYIPHINFPGSRFIWKPGVVPLENFGEAEVVWVQRQISEGNYQAIVTMKTAGFKVVYDTDDDLWNLPAANPHAKLFRENQSGFTRCASLCDVITVSTRGLRSAVKSALPSFKGEILICPNAMDFNLFNPPSVERDPERFVIGWAGSNTHREDVKEVWEVLPGILEEFDHVHMEFIGMLPPAKIANHPHVKARKFYPVGEYLARFSTWAWDLTFAPLADVRFNRSKSAIKALEAAALGIPCLMSNVQTYDEVCQLGHIQWLLCSNSKEWKEKLRALISDHVLYGEYAEKLHATAMQWYNAATLNSNWVHAARVACGLASSR